MVDVLAVVFLVYSLFMALLYILRIMAVERLRTYHKLLNLWQWLHFDLRYTFSPFKFLRFFKEKSLFYYEERYADLKTHLAFGQKNTLLIKKFQETMGPTGISGVSLEKFYL